LGEFSGEFEEIGETIPEQQVSYLSLPFQPAGSPDGVKGTWWA
jgi:hypothetical protein